MKSTLIESIFNETEIEKIKKTGIKDRRHPGEEWGQISTFYID